MDLAQLLTKVSLFKDIDKIILNLIWKNKGAKEAETLFCQFWDLIDNYSDDDCVVFKEIDTLKEQNKNPRDRLTINRTELDFD